MTQTIALLTSSSLFFVTLSFVANVAQAEAKKPRPKENICVANDIYVSCDLLEDCLLSNGEIGTMDGVPVCFEETAVQKHGKLKSANNSLFGQKAIGTSPSKKPPLKSFSGQNSRIAKAVQ